MMTGKYREKSTLVVNSEVQNPLRHNNQLICPVEEYYDFVVDTSQIRACSDYIHQTYHDGNMTEQEHDHRYRNEFLPMIDRFKGKWGSKMVPEDIRAAVGGVERGVGVPITVWPEWVYAR